MQDAMAGFAARGGDSHRFVAVRLSSYYAAVVDGHANQGRLLPPLSRLLCDPAMQELGCLRCWGEKEWTHLLVAFLGFCHAFA